MSALSTRETVAGDSRAREWQRLLGRAVWPALVPGALLFGIVQVASYAHVGAIGLDSHAYWLAARYPETWYSRPPRARDAFLYSPAFGQVLEPFGALPWPVFQLLWAAVSVAVLAWLLAPLGRRGLVLAPFFVPEILAGNVYVLLAAAVVLTVTGWPGALALPVLTKIGPGVTGIWLLGRREWRAALWALGTTGAVVLVSWLIAPDAWVAWLHFLQASAADGGAAPTARLVLAAAVVLWAARRGQAWLLAPAMILACPVLGGYGPFAILAAIPRLLQWQRAQAATGEASSDRTGVQSLAG